jgi:hypothetical protein
MKALILLLILVSLAVKAQTKVGNEPVLDLHKRPNDSCAIGVIEQNNLASYWRCDDGFYEINAATFAESIDVDGGSKFIKMKEADWNQKLKNVVVANAVDVSLNQKTIAVTPKGCIFSIMYASTEYKLCGSSFYKSVKGGLQQIQASEWNRITWLARTHESEPTIKASDKKSIDSERVTGKDLKSDDEEKKTGSSQSGAEQE